MIIGMATRLHQFKPAEDKEDLLRNNLGVNQVWLNNYHQNMGRARHQIYKQVEQTSFVIKNHRSMNDPKVVDQSWTIVPYPPKVCSICMKPLVNKENPKDNVD